MDEFMNADAYRLQNAEGIPSPALIFYKEIIQKNIQSAIKTAGGADRLWPHMKTHKCREIIKMQMEQGISRFKCATIAEAEMTAQCNPDAVLLAYPLVGPNIGRFLALTEKYPGVAFYAIGDDLNQLTLLSQAALAQDTQVSVLLDVNLGMNRTGASYDQADALYRKVAALEGLVLKGLHCYDGQRSEAYDIRVQKVEESLQPIHALVDGWRRDGLDADILVMGGTPSFPCHAAYEDVYLSPGTLIVMDAGYQKKYPELDYMPGAAVMTRVVSHPGDGIFTIDLGYKGISADPAGSRGVLLGAPDAEVLFQSEEHWTWQMKPGHEGERPPIGSVLYVLPTHICPTVALYAFALVAQSGRITGKWEIAGRDRCITV
jgi:D-serine deaminase-like pyridoxal phosphate-dependent protein